MMQRCHEVENGDVYCHELRIGRQWRWHHGTSCWLPSWPIVGQHHLRVEGCGSEMMSSCSNVNNDNDNGANDDGQFRLIVSPLINKQRNARFRQTDLLDKPVNQKLPVVKDYGI